MAKVFYVFKIKIYIWMHERQFALLNKIEKIKKGRQNYEILLFIHNLKGVSFNFVNPVKVIKDFRYLNNQR